MALSLSKSQLTSRAIRKSTTPDRSGIRSLNLWDSTLEVQQPRRGIIGAIVKVFNAGKRLVGFIGSSFGWIPTSITDALDILLDINDELWSFDFNITLEEANQNAKRQMEDILSQLASLAGATVGWVASAAVGYGITLYIPVIGGKVLAKMIGTRVLQEAAQDLVGRLTTIVLSTARTIVTTVLTYGWIGVRNTYRALTRAGARAAAANRGRLDELNAYFEEQDAKPWVLREKREELIRYITPDWAERYVFDFLDSLQETFIEGLYVVASELDAAYDESKRQEAAIELKPDKDAEETFYLYGNQATVMTQAHQLLQTHRTLANRDVGYWVGDTELTGRVPTSQKTLKLFFFPYERPPWRRGSRGENKGIISRFVIKDLKTGITWQELKTACRRFTTGSVRVTAFLDNGRQMCVLANTEEEGQDKLSELVTLTTRQIMRFSSGEQKLVRQTQLTRATDRTRPEQLRPPTLLYPAYAYLFVNLRWVEGRTGHPAAPEGITPSGDAYFTRRLRFNLHPDNQPANFPSTLL